MRNRQKTGINVNGTTNKCLKLLFFTMAILMFVAQATAQADVGEGAIAGIITDASTGSVISGATITVTNSSGNVFTNTSDAEGQYLIILPSPADGNYSVEASATGFQNEKNSNVTIPKPEQTQGQPQATMVNFSLEKTTPIVTPTPIPETTPTPIPETTPAPFGFTVIPQSITVTPSENAVYDLNISNMGNFTDIYTFSVDNGGANVVLSMNNTSVDNVSIEPQENANLFMTVNSAVTGTFTVNVTATSEANSNNMTVSTNTIVGAIPTVPGVNAMRKIDSQFIGPGDSTTVIVNISSGVTQALVLQETIPEGWNLTRISDDADSYRTSNFSEWLWINVTSGTSKTVVYKLTAPSNASIGDYSIDGSIVNSTGMVAVGGNNTVSISIIGYYRKLGDNPNKIDTSDVLKAIQDWREGVMADGFGRTITSEEIATMLDAWAIGE